MLFALGIDVEVQRPHDANSREHLRATEISHQHQRLDCGLSFRLGRFLLRQPGNVGRGGVERVSTYCRHPGRRFNEPRFNGADRRHA
jgi:hypothetical protein